MNMLRGFILLLQFFTRIPVPVKMEYDDRLYSRNIFLIPVVGLILGLPLFGIYTALAVNGDSRFLAAVLIVAGEVLLTGALHIDGLADSADGFFSYRDRERMLEIMKDSRIGTNGTLAVFMVLLLRVALLFSISPEKSAVMVLLMPVFTRLTIPWLAGVSVYARKEGMGGALVNSTGALQIVLSTAVTAAISIGVSLWLGFNLLHIPVLIAAIAVFAVALSRYSTMKIGGITGDVVGAGIETSEIFFLTAVLVLEKIPMEYLAI